MKIKVADATKLQLDWLMAKAEGMQVAVVMNERVPQVWNWDDINPNTTYKNKVGEHRFLLNGKPVGLFGNPVEYTGADMWPIIEREGIGIFQCSRDLGKPCNYWVATIESQSWDWSYTTWHEDKSIILYKSDTYVGPTPLIAALRCYVANTLGEEVEIPEELK
jgi:hypothetical protein